MNSNPRITNFVSTTKDENNLLKIMSDFKSNESATLHWVLCKYIECSLVKDQPEFINILFNDHLPLVVEMFQWMLTPKIIGKKKKIKSNLDFFPFRCKDFMKDNILFYQKLYISALNNKFAMATLFDFLRHDYFDSETVLTALGYFGQVFIPFAKYEFSNSNSLFQSLGHTKNDNQNESQGIMKILPKILINQLLTHCHYQQIFQFLKTSILISIQDPLDYEVSHQTLLKIFLHPQISDIFNKLNSSALSDDQQHQIKQKIDVLDFICASLKQLIVNIEPNNDVQRRIQYFIYILLQSKLIPYVVNQILQSNLCNQVLKQKSLTNSVDLASSLQLVNETSSSSTNNQYFSQVKIPSPKNMISLDDQYQDEDLMQIMLRILGLVVEIYVRVPKTVPIKDEKLTEINKLDRYSYYLGLMNTFHEQMQTVLDGLEKMTKLVYNQPDSGISTYFKSIPFSSGQKIKAVSIMKFQYFKLLHNCLIMIQCPQNLQAKIEKITSLRKLKSIIVPPFELKIQKLHIIQIIQKYLSRNRWNNIAHLMLEKICHALIICGYEYIRKNIQKSLNKKSSQSFISFLIENFTQRHYIFLNTFKFTNQGNLQSIYNISKDLAYTLNSTNQLVVLLGEFEPWKKFLMTDLKLYEEKAYPQSTRPSESHYEERDEEESGIKVDEVDSIRKLIDNISTTKWPKKIKKQKPICKSGIIRNSDEVVDLDEPPLSKSNEFYQYQKKQPLKKTLDQILKKRVEFSIQFDPDHQIQETNVEDISVRQKIAKSKKAANPPNEVKKKTKKEESVGYYNLFKSYSTGKK